MIYQIARGPLRSFVTAVACSTILSLGGVAASQVLDLVSPATQNSLAGTDPALQGKDVLRARSVSMDLALSRRLSSTASADAANPLRLRVPFFDDVVYEVEFAKSIQYKPGQVSYVGTVVGKPLATATMSLVDGVAILDVRMNDGFTYALRPVDGSSAYTSKELAEANQGTCGVNDSFRNNLSRIQERMARTSDKAESDRPVASADPNDQVDVIIGYTPAARIAAGGTAAMVAVANQSVTFANTAYTNSLVTLSIVPVWIGEVDYKEDSVDMFNDLSKLTTNNDGHLDELVALREAHRADMVTLLVKDVVGGTCGIAWQMNTPSSGFASNAYSVTARTCVTNQTFAHELGHNMGCAHARGDGGTGSYTYSYGHKWTGLSSTAYRSVMAYAPGTRIQYFSNPSVNFDGVATGVAIGQPTEAHNANTLTLNAPTICNWRQRKSGAESAALQAPASIAFGSIVGGTNRTASTLRVGNSGDGVINYTLTDDVAWLSLPANGSVNGTTEGSKDNAITFNTTGLGVGIHTGNITVTAVGVTGSPKVIPVTISVTDPSVVTNDNFANAYLISGNSLTTTAVTTDFTVESGEPTSVATFSTGSSAWWKWTNSTGTNKNVVISISSATFDTQLSVYTGSAVNALTAVVEDDEIPPTLESVSFVAAPGQTYHIRLAGYSGETGTASLGGSLPVSMSLMVVD